MIVPSNAGVGSAVGFLAAPIAYELVRSRHVRLDDFDVGAVSDLLHEMATEARTLVEPGAAGAPVRERRVAFMRYVGQGHEITVELPNRRLTAADLPGLRQSFETDYTALGQVVEIPLYHRDQMAPGATIAGPAVIAEDETSTFVSTSFDAHIDGAGSIVMERKAA